MFVSLSTNRRDRWASPNVRIGLAILVALLVSLALSEVTWARSFYSAPQEESETPESTVSVTFIVEGMMKSKSGAT